MIFISTHKFLSSLSASKNGQNFNHHSIVPHSLYLSVEVFGLFGPIPNCAHGLVLVLCSGIISGEAVETSVMQGSNPECCVQSKYLIYFIKSPTPLFQSIHLDISVFAQM